MKVRGEQAVFNKSAQVLKNGEWKTTQGYLNSKLQTYIGLHTSRLVSDFNVPDLTLLPQKYPSLKTMEFKAGKRVAGITLLSIRLMFYH